MADPLTINVAQAAEATPVAYTVPGSAEVEPLSAFAHFDGTGAAGSFRPTLTFYSAAGLILARVFPGDTVVAGGTADVTFAPFLGNDAAASGGGSGPVDFVDFNPVTGQLQITSNNPAVPTDVVASGAVTLDGTQTAVIEFFAAAWDVDQRGKAVAGANLLELYRDATAIGIVGDESISAGGYINMQLYTKSYDTPAAGTYVYSVKAYQQPGGGAQGNSFIYATNTTTPHATRPGYLSVSVF